MENNAPVKQMRPSHTISLSQLKFAYPAAKNALILDIPQWQIKAGRSVFLQGPSGAGKSTLLHLLSGLLLPISGQLEVLGTALTELSGRERDRFRANHIGLIGQVFNLVPYLTVRNNLQLAGYFADIKPDEEQIRQAMTELKLSPDLLDRRADQLSIGQQQRVAIARALMKHPQLVIADEPTSALDHETQGVFMELLLNQCKHNHSTLIFVSHDRSLANHFDELIQLNQLNLASEEASSC